MHRMPTLSATRTPSFEAVARLHDRGHVVLRGLLDADEVGLLRSRLLDAAASAPELVPTDEEGAVYARAFRQTTNLWRHDRAVEAFVRCPRLAHAAATLLGVGAVRLYHDQLLVKRARDGGRTPWHQDHHYWPVDRPMLTFWMPLQRLDPSMGMLRFASGRHREGALSTAPISDRSDRDYALALRGTEVRGTGPMAPGDVSAHLSWTPHAADPNTSARDREAMTVILMPADARVVEPSNAGQANDLASWLPGCRPGDLAASPLNPLCG